MRAWDELSKELLGSEKFTHLLMKENPELSSKYWLVPEGVKLKIPQVSETKSEELPPWKE
ncbi:MAG: phage tail protein [Aquifex sp.]|nr:MAG: phage tail protein [Aquifex sp.]